MNILVTGGLGFIGTNFIRYVLEKRPAWRVTNLDKMTYCGNPANHTGLETDRRYQFVHGDICDTKLVSDLLTPSIDAVIHFAAETHVDRSLVAAEDFTRTNITGTVSLLECARRVRLERFVHISTDEVYGANRVGASAEIDPLRATVGNPYAITKEAGDKLAQSYWLHPYHVPVTIIRPSNNFGPFQYPEKFIPLAITNALDDKPIPVYGDGLQVRDWLYVEDNCEAILAALEKGKPGEIYNVGGYVFRDYTNKEVAERIVDHLHKDRRLITHVGDRAHHDRRYSLSYKKLTEQTGWEPKTPLLLGLEKTIEWYRQNRTWWEPITTGAFKQWYEQQYKAL
ncbi:dTDP-glucose 4,6-dehydratase [Candidatus Woesearchaeota archaeon]|nr:dTDP-glucose 4,6-dehydratase [Candidatus Woesearchaeota archaeon]